MEPVSYSIFRKLSNGNYQCIDETSTLEQAQMIILLLEADHPGDYVAVNQASGKEIHARFASNYVS